MDMENVMSWLEGLAQPDWHKFHSDTEVQVIAESTLALMKEQDGLMLALDQSNAVNGYLNAEVERLNGLLKEQEAVEPRVSTAEQRCGHCNKVIEMDGWQACPWCGKRINWESWWRKNEHRQA